MDKKVKNRENQERFAQAQKELGLKRLMLWVRPEDADTLKLAARQPHSLAALRKKIEAELERKLRPIVKKKVEAKLRRRTERALLVQKRSQARKRLSGSNRPPEGTVALFSVGQNIAEMFERIKQPRTVGR